MSIYTNTDNHVIYNYKSTNTKITTKAYNNFLKEHQALVLRYHHYYDLNTTLDKVYQIC